MNIQASSASSQASDLYRAGASLGEQLAPIHPEVVFLFGSVAYGTSAEVLEGLHDALGGRDPAVIGSSGDGIYEAGLVAEHGVAALGIDTGGAVRWRVAGAGGAAAAPTDATRACLRQLEARSGGERPTLMVLFADFRADASRIERVLRDEVDVPVVGGLAADDNRHLGCHLYVNREVQRDSIVMLGAYGPLGFDISIANVLRPVGRPGIVEAAEGTRIDRISGRTATDFVATETGKPVLQTDRGIITLSVSDAAKPCTARLRSIVPALSPLEESLGVYGSVEPGESVQVCLPSPEDLVSGIDTIAERARGLELTPKAAVVVSCVGRKWLLGGRVEHEVSALSRAFPGGLPLVGMPSFGEIGPLRDGARYSPTLFHNMTYILLLLGEPPRRP